MRSRFVNQRLAAVPMEPSATVAIPDGDGGVRIWAPLQAPHTARDVFAGSLGLDKEAVHVTVPNVGGGFGARIAAYPEQAAVAAAALRLGKPVRYVESRWETMIAMQHGRAQVQDVELGARSDGTLVGIRVHVIADCGAYPADAVIMPFLTGQMASGVYNVPRVDFGFTCVVTNTTPIGAYRGAGRPEATALIERAMNQLAEKLELDPAELRRRNFIAPDDFPHKTVAGATYDSGEYARALDGVLEAAGYDALRSEQAQRRERGDVRQLGIGLCTYVELTGLGVEVGTCTVDEEGIATVKTGTSPQGQGHETTWAQLVSWTLGVPMDDVRVVHSDTRKVPRGMGTMGSRTLQVGGSAMINATREVLAKGRELAAHLLEAAVDDIEVVPGQGLGVAGTPTATVSWAELAKAAADPARLPEGMEPGLDAINDFETPDSSYPFGAHIAVVEVDMETGLTKLIRHVTVDDSGNIANPLLAEGQIHGGIAQGVAQALYEEIAYDEDGNCVAGSLTSYALPTAAELPFFETARTETPSPLNPLGAKGIGESGAIGATPGGVERGRRRAVASGGREHRHARDADAGVAGDRVGAQRRGGVGPVAGRGGGLDLVVLLEALQSVPEPHAPAEQDRDHHDVQVVDEPGGEEVADHRGASADAHVLAVRGLAGRLERLGRRRVEEVERRAALHLDRRARVMGEDEDRCVERRVGTPRALPLRVLVPAGVAELPGTHDLGADPRIVPPHEDVVDAAATAGLAHHRVANIHSCSRVAGVTEMRVVALTLAGAEAVERDGEVVDAGE